MLTHAFHDFPERSEKLLETKAPSEDGKTKVCCLLAVGRADWSCPLHGLTHLDWPPACAGCAARAATGLGPVGQTSRVLLCVTSTCSPPGKGKRTSWSKSCASVLWCDPSEMPLGLGGTSQITGTVRMEMCSHCHLLSAPSPATWSWEQFPECPRQSVGIGTRDQTSWGQWRELWCDVAGAMAGGNKWW